jgi:ribosomal protein S18 acetylase RimI-like enzyme
MNEPTIKIRPAWANDAPALARVHVDAWRTTYRGTLPAEGLAGLSYDRREHGWSEVLALLPEQRHFIFVAQDQTGQVVGFSSAGRETSGDPVYKSELYAIYILEEHQRRGLGRRLMHAALDGLVQAGYTAMLLWVLADNVGGRRFYEMLGGRVLREKPIEIFGVTIKELAYGWDDLAKLMSATTPE